MKTLIQFMIVFNTAMFIIGCMHAGVSVGAGLIDKALFFGIAALIHKFFADYWKKKFHDKFPEESQ